nr:hypothetical protein [uncultured bacterium]
MDQIISLFGRPDHVAYDIRSLRNKANPDDTFEAQLFYGDLKAIVKTSHLVKIDYPKFIVHGKKGSFIKYGIDQQETSLKANIMPGEPGFAADDYGKTVSRRDFDAAFAKSWGKENVKAVKLTCQGNPAYLTEIQISIKADAINAPLSANSFLPQPHPGNCGKTFVIDKAGY